MANTEALLEDWREEQNRAEVRAESAEGSGMWALAGFWWKVADGFGECITALEDVREVFGPDVEVIA